jgi:hexokinase
MDSEVFAISQSVMTGSGEALFDHIAACLHSFAVSRGVHEEVLPLGFTFSFPCRQKGLAVGELIAWTKGFSCEGVEGKDVVALLQVHSTRCIAKSNTTYIY